MTANRINMMGRKGEAKGKQRTRTKRRKAKQTPGIATTG